MKYSKTAMDSVVSAHRCTREAVLQFLCPACGYFYLRVGYSKSNNTTLRCEMTYDCPACEFTFVIVMYAGGVGSFFQEFRVL